MKIQGLQVKAPKPITFKIYRVDDENKPQDFEFVCGAVLSYDDFDKLCPMPVPPQIRSVKAGTSLPDHNDAKYKKAVTEWSERRVEYMFIKSLEATPDLTWETVQIIDPDTWKNYKSELELVLTTTEVNDLINTIVEANSPSQKRRDEAIKNFTSTTPVVTAE